MLEIVAASALVLFAITEFFYPLLAGKPLFGSFRKKPVKTTTTLDDELAEARRKVDEVKEVQRKADEALRRAEAKKNAADDLMH
ncbi:MAG TPA: hypothetical protein PK760_07780 [Flavobacteriales bacterium]|nr:hypothetical protein [Flavobacteriales bacterium]